MRYILFILTLFVCQVSSADNGHLVHTNSTNEYNVAIFVEPWPVRVGEMQIQFVVTDLQGNLLEKEVIQPYSLRDTISIAEAGSFSLKYAINSEMQEPIPLEVLPKANPIIEYWAVWLFLIFGVIFIILREKLARNMQERYPSL